MKRQQKRECLQALMGQSADWIAASLAQPNRHMCATCLVLHRVALRRKGVSA